MKKRINYIAPHREKFNQNSQRTINKGFEDEATTGYN